ncbi:hypothetical protein Bealeia2_01868 [Candidatus Bealeia paramacronuclearis]|nr:hypothetical protein [Candidatus Bealeia paramacronuclearis]
MKNLVWTLAFTLLSSSVALSDATLHFQAGKWTVYNSPIGTSYTLPRNKLNEEVIIYYYPANSNSTNGAPNCFLTTKPGLFQDDVEYFVAVSFPPHCTPPKDNSCCISVNRK